MAFKGKQRGEKVSNISKNVYGWGFEYGSQGCQVLCQFLNTCTSRGKNHNNAWEIGHSTLPTFFRSMVTSLNQFCRPQQVGHIVHKILKWKIRLNIICHDKNKCFDMSTLDSCKNNFYCSQLI